MEWDPGVVVWPDSRCLFWWAGLLVEFWAVGVAEVGWLDLKWSGFLFPILSFLLRKGCLVRRTGCGGAFKSGLYRVWVARLDGGVWMARWWWKRGCCEVWKGQPTSRWVWLGPMVGVGMWWWEWRSCVMEMKSGDSRQFCLVEMEKCWSCNWLCCRVEMWER